MASQWKSQFDDSEETDDELQGEHLQSPEHLPALARLGVAMLQQQMFGYGSAPTSPIMLQATGPNQLGEQATANDFAGAAQYFANERSSAVSQQNASGQTALCITTLPRRHANRTPSERPNASKDGETQLVKGSTLDGLDVEGADTMQVASNR